MNTLGFYLGPDRDLTKDELEALLNIKAGVRVSEWYYTKLEATDLIEKGLGGWKLTDAGRDAKIAIRARIEEHAQRISIHTCSAGNRQRGGTVGWNLCTHSKACNRSNVLISG